MLPDLGIGPLPFSGEKTSPADAEHGDVFNAWKASPSPATTGALLKAVHPVLESAVKSYGGGSAASPNLMGHARQLAIQAFGTYDQQKGTLRTHLLSQLPRLRRLAAHEQNIISMPEQVGLDRSHVMGATQELRDRLGRDPSDSELGHHTGLSLKRLAYIRQAHTPIAEGTAEGVAGTSMPQSQRINDHSADDAWNNLVYHDQGPVDQVIMEHLLGMHGKQVISVQEIARKLGITSGAVSQRAARIQQQLNERESLHLF